MKFSSRSVKLRRPQTPFNAVSTSTAPGSSSASRFHSWKWPLWLVIEPTFAFSPLPNVTTALWWKRCGTVSR